MSDALPVLMRPKTLKEVIGQDEVVAALGKIVKSKRVPHCFLFTGPSGVGKTTLARILASLLKVDSDHGVMEIDAATNTGIEKMRGVLEKLMYRSFSENGRKFLIVDEAHRLSRSAWDSLLKPIEEPPEHVFWAFCTTEPDKVPATIVSRCTSFTLRAVAWDTIADLLNEASEKQDIEIESDILELCARNANGNVRQALVYLEQCKGVESKKEAARLMSTGVGDEKEAIELARMVCKGQGFTWPAAMKIVQALKEESPEGIRLVVVNYAASMLFETTKPERLLAVLEAFRGPYNQSERFAPLFLSLGALLFAE